MKYSLAEKLIDNLVLDFDQTMYPDKPSLRRRSKILIGHNIAIHILSKRTNTYVGPADIANLEKHYHEIAKKIGHSKAFEEIGGDPADYFGIIRQTEQSPILKYDPKLVRMLDLMSSHAELFIFTGSYLGPVTRSLDVLLADQAGLINQVVGYDTLKHGKPTVEAYLEMADFLHIDPTRSVMVDDSTTEIDVAKSIGMMGVLVGQHTPEEKTLADASISTIHSLLKVLTQK